MRVHLWLGEVISTRGMREWTEIGFSSIYYLLGRLRDRGLITEIDTPRAARGKARRVYGPTAEGRRACARSAEAAVAELRPVFPPSWSVWPINRSFRPSVSGPHSTGGPQP
jgi:DNA-binding PadR family transcriptional regulator